jgi:hypothetical protein
LVHFFQFAEVLVQGVDFCSEQVHEVQQSCEADDVCKILLDADFEDSRSSSYRFFAEVFLGVDVDQDVSEISGVVVGPGYQDCVSSSDSLVFGDDVGQPPSVASQESQFLWFFSCESGCFLEDLLVAGW